MCDKPPQHPNVAGTPSSRMKILSLGLPKTGTASLAAAYRILGFDRVHHGIEAAGDYEFWPRYERACDATFTNLPPPASGPRPPPLTRSDWDTVWGPDVEAVTDLAGFFGPQLVEAYPDVKVVLCERDVDRWYDSIENAVLKPLWEMNWTGRVLLWFVESATGLRGATATKKAYYGLFRASSADEIRAHAKDTYREYYARMKALVPSERLLVYRMGEGWDPLCRFLDRPVPAVEFPRVNESEAARKHIEDSIRKYAVRGAKTAAMRLIWPGLAVAIVVAAWFATARVPASI